jgi:hypothetical protein
MNTIETRFAIGDMVYRSDEGLFSEPREITAILKDKNHDEPYYYLGGCNNYPESSLRTKDEQIIAIQARVVKFIQGE